MLSSKQILVVILYTCYLTNSVLALKDYCNIDGESVLEKFEQCSIFLESTTDSTELKTRLFNVINFTKDENHSEFQTINFFMEMLTTAKLINAANDNFKYCFNYKECHLFKNCQFPVNLTFESLKRINKSANKMAATLTAFSINEERDNRIYLTRSNLEAQLKLVIADYNQIYDSKIIFKKIPNKQSSSLIQVSKNLMNNQINVNYQQEVDENFEFDSWNQNKEIVKADSKSAAENSYPKSDQFDSAKHISDLAFDCEVSVWRQIVTVPFLYSSGQVRGYISYSVSMNSFDLKQCGVDSNTHQDTNGLIVNLDNPFYNTDKCDRKTTECVNEEGKGFTLNSYTCQCKPGFYAEKQNTSKTLACLKCSEGCDTCLDATSCKIKTSMQLKKICLLINFVCILICILLIIHLLYHMSKKMLKTSSSNMLIMVLIGAILTYCEIIPMYFTPNYWTCTAAQILQTEGFLLAYGALVLKIWRECKLFYVRSVRTIRVTDNSLMKRLSVIILVGTIFLIVWALRKNDSPREVELRDINNLKYLSCTITGWNYFSQLIQIAVLSYGVVQAIHVRRASIAFKETKLITLAIFNECLFKIVVISVTYYVFQNEAIKLYVSFPFMFSFLRIHLTITVMILLIFVYKVFTIFGARKKPYQSNQSALLNNFTIASANDGEQKNSSICEEKETEKEKELKVEIQRLCRQLEETRSLSMRIANPHLLTKKSRFINYPTKTAKKKSKYLLPLPLDSGDMPSKTDDRPEGNALLNKEHRLKSVEEEPDKIKS